MLGGKNKDNHFAAGGTTLLAKSAEVHGDIKFGGTLEIEGRVVGNIIAMDDPGAQVNIRESGVVEGEIRAPQIMINGAVKGDVYSDKHLELAAKAAVTGNVNYSVIEMVKGAEVNGSLVHLASDKAGPTIRAAKVGSVKAAEAG